VDVEHRGAPYVGELVHAELGTDRKLRCVAVLDVDYTEDDGQLYFSGSYATEEPSSPRVAIHDRVRLIGLSITDEPGNLDAQPLRSRSGDVRRSPERYHWPISWRSDQLLARAADAHKGSQARVVTHIVDLEPAQLPFATELTTSEMRELERAQELPGGLRRSAWRGRVISVR
jgi:hypothetical protein